MLFTNRLRPSVSAAQIGFTIDEARTFCAAARAQAERYRNALALDPETLEGWARDYATRIRPFPVRSVDEIIALLEDAGFAPDRVDTAPFAGMSGSVAIAGPTVADRAEFVRVLATRR